MTSMTVETIADRRGRAGRAVRRTVLLGGLAVLVTCLLWARGLPRFVAWEVARDHERCLRGGRGGARLWSNDPGYVRDWLESRGVPVQPLPPEAEGFTLLGVRDCPLTDRSAAHLLYGGQRSYVSVFVLGGPARFRDGWRAEVGTVKVRLLRSAGRTLAIAGRSAAAVEAVTRAFASSQA